MPEILQVIPNIHYVIAGKGPDRVRIERMICQMHLQKYVTLAGFVPDQQLCDYYNLCDVFVMPSKREGFGIVYLEAMASGKPTVGGNQDGAMDALCQGEIGALVDPDDISELARTLLEILQGNYKNSLLYDSDSLRRRVIEIYGLNTFKNNLKSLLKPYYRENIST